MTESIDARDLAQMQTEQARVNLQPVADISNHVWRKMFSRVFELNFTAQRLAVHLVLEVMHPDGVARNGEILIFERHAERAQRMNHLRPIRPRAKRICHRVALCCC
jgi:hypothetical protein